MKFTTPAPSLATIKEEFSLSNATLFGGLNPYLDYLEGIGLLEMLQRVDVEKADYSTYDIQDVCLAFICGHTLDKNSILQLEALEEDPLLTEKLGLEKLPDYTLYYDELRRFDNQKKISSLKQVNKGIIARVLPASADVILDFDSSVTTVYGDQEEADRGYNPQKKGRKSYHPFFCFDGRSKLCLNSELRAGSSTNSPDFASFYQETKNQLPYDSKVKYARFDKAFGGEGVYAPLEADGVGYVGKLKATARLREYARTHGFKRVDYNSELIIEAKSFYYQATTWKKKRRVVVLRTKKVWEDDPQLTLGNELWEYRYLVTNLPSSEWTAEDIWRFYNQRCGSENYIKELKTGFAIGDFPTGEFYPNAADLMLKVISYNCFIGFKEQICTSPFKNFTIDRMRRYLLLIPAVVTYHARRISLKLAEGFRYQKEFHTIRRRVNAAFT